MPAPWTGWKKRSNNRNSSNFNGPDVCQAHSSLYELTTITQSPGNKSRSPSLWTISKFESEICSSSFLSFLVYCHSLLRNSPGEKTHAIGPNERHKNQVFVCVLCCYGSPDRSEDRWRGQVMLWPECGLETKRRRCVPGSKAWGCKDAAWTKRSCPVLLPQALSLPPRTSQRHWCPCS